MLAGVLALVFLLGACFEKLPESPYRYYLEAFFGLTAAFCLLDWLYEPVGTMIYHSFWIPLPAVAVYAWRKRRRAAEA